MHIDQLQARRTQAGAPVVHGIHLLLWTLDRLAAAQPGLPPLSRLRADFSKFVYVGECVDLTLTKQSATRLKLVISVDHMMRSSVTVYFGDAALECPDWTVAPLASVMYSPLPLNLTFEQIQGRSGRLSFRLSPEQAQTMFPAGTQWLGARRISALAASTCLVGMICPGLQSLFTELALSACTDCEDEDTLAYRVVETDARFRWVDQEIAGGGFRGSVRSFVRLPPVQQAAMRAVAGMVSPGEFAGSVALVVGGSRGLGEVTAKLLAAGGAHVILTWHTGKAEAETVAQEIRSAGGSCETLAYDARQSPADQLALLTQAPSHAYYFATPAIYRPHGGIYNADRLKDFLAVYVDGFLHLMLALRAKQPAISLFYPSSVFVSTRPKGMTEYSMAKAAGEILGADINESFSPTHVTSSRLPRMLTDQTASIMAAEAIDPVCTMLPLVRDVQSWPKQPSGDGSTP